MFNKPTMTMELKYKKPSVHLLNMINQMAGEHTAYMKNAKSKAQAIIEQAREEGLPNEQLRKLITDAFKKAGLSDRTLRDALPAELKNKNMVRQHPKKEPLVKEWKLEFNVREIANQINNMLTKGITKAYFTHDERRITGVEIY